MRRGQLLHAQVGYHAAKSCHRRIEVRQQHRLGRVLLKPSASCGCREPRQTSSRDEPVLVDEPSEEVLPTQSRRIAMLDWPGQRPSRFQRRLLTQGAVRAMSVVVADELGQNGLELAPMKDE